MADAVENSPRLAAERPMFSRRGRTELGWVSLVAALVLFSLVNPSLPFEQDQGSKVAKIQSLARAPFLDSPMHGPQYYRESYFGLYYQAEALLLRLVPASGVAVTNYSAAACGVLFIFTTAILMRRLTGVGPWWVLLLVLNTPALTVNFLYGNEASMALALGSSALALIVLRWGFRSDASAGVLLGLSLFCRPDVILLAPFVFVLLCARGSGDRLSFELSFRRTFLIASAAGIAAGAYWLAFIRVAPSETSFTFIVDFRMIAAYTIFGLGPAVLLVAGLGVGRLVARGRIVELALPLSTFVPLLFYYRNLGSAKYIAGMAFGTLLGAAWGITLAPRWGKPLCLASCVLIWLFAVTPFGVFGPLRGGHWVVPTADGPIPFGSYGSFYMLVRRGFFQSRYHAMLRSWDSIVERVKADHQPVTVLGFADNHMLDLACERQGFSSHDLPISIDQFGKSAGARNRFFMLFNGYSRLTYMNNRGELVKGWLQKGMVKTVYAPLGSEALPLVVEVGPAVDGGSAALGRRLLWTDQFSRQGGLAPLPFPVPDYRDICWVPAASAPVRSVYSDDEFSATTECGNHSDNWGNWWPAVYYQRFSAEARDAITAR